MHEPAIPRAEAERLLRAYFRFGGSWVAVRDTYAKGRVTREIVVEIDSSPDGHFGAGTARGTVSLALTSRAQLVKETRKVMAAASAQRSYRGMPVARQPRIPARVIDRRRKVIAVMRQQRGFSA